MKVEICRSLFECLGALGRSQRLYAATGLVDEEGLETASRVAGELRVLTGDAGPVPRLVYDKWREVVRIYPGLHAKFYIFGEDSGPSAALVGSADLTAGGLRGNLEAIVIIRGEATRLLADMFNKLWAKALPLTEDYVADWEGPEEALRKTWGEAVKRANERLAEILGVSTHCLFRHDPLNCARVVASAVRSRFEECGDLPENCAARAAGISTKTLLSAPPSAVLAGHYVCWARALAAKALEGRVRRLSSGMEVYEAAVRAGAESCWGEAKRAAEEELKRLEDNDYRDNYVRWRIPYRLLFLAMTLPAVGCRIVGREVKTKGGRVIRVERELYC